MRDLWGFLDLGDSWDPSSSTVSPTVLWSKWHNSPLTFLGGFGLQGFHLIVLTPNVISNMLTVSLGLLALGFYCLALRLAGGWNEYIT